MDFKKYVSGLSLQEGASALALEEAAATLGITFPADYVEFMMMSNGAEGSVGEGSYLQLWPIEALVPRNLAYAVGEFAPELVVFASDGGGEAYAFRRLQDQVDIVKVPFIGMGREPAIFHGGTFRDFLELLLLAEDDNMA